MKDWRPSAGVEAARRRESLLGRLRDRFALTGTLAVDTPALGAAPNTDPAIESLAVTTAAGDRLFLQTSPEFYLKRLLAAGYPDIYSIARVFRDGEAGRRHLPEFTLVEWYRHGYDLDAIIDDTAALVAAGLDDPGIAARTVCTDYRDALVAHTGIDMFSASIDDLAAAAGGDADLGRALGDDRDAWLDLLFELRVLPALDPGVPTVIRHFPASKAALARLCPADDRVADRFELFLGGLELANGYVELTDAAEQRRRMQADNERRQRTGRTPLPLDERFLAALEAGLPDCAGVALGLERLQMVYDRAETVTDVVTFGAETDGDPHRGSR